MIELRNVTGALRAELLALQVAGKSKVQVALAAALATLQDANETVLVLQNAAVANRLRIELKAARRVAVAA
jgi:hypothetical protein